MEKNLQNDEALKKFTKLVNEIRVCMFITHDGPNGHTRPMYMVEVDEQGTLWFFTDIRSIKVEEISQQHQAHLVYSHPGKNCYLDVWGNASVNPDKQLIRDKWSSQLKDWFPKGADDPNIALLAVRPTEVYYWDAGSTSMVSFLKLAAGGTKSREKAEGTEGKLKVS